MPNAYDPDELLRLQVLLSKSAMWHRQYINEAITRSSDSEALRSVRAAQYAAKIRALTVAMVELADLQCEIYDADQDTDERRTKEVNDLLNPSHN